MRAKITLTCLKTRSLTFSNNRFQQTRQTEVLMRTGQSKWSLIICYRSYSVIGRTVFFKKFLISTKNYRQSLGASYRRIFSRNNFFLSQLLVRFQANKRTQCWSLTFINMVVLKRRAKSNLHRYDTCSRARAQ